MSGGFLIYVDDSGNEDIGTLFSAVIVPADSWSTALDYWLGLRNELLSDFQLPIGFELHARPFLSLQPMQEVDAAQKKRDAILGPKSRDPDSILGAVGLARAQIELSEVGLTNAIRAADAAGRDVSAIARAARLAQEDVREALERAYDPNRLEGVECLRETAGSRTTRREIFGRLVQQLVNLPDVQVATCFTTETTGEAKIRLYEHLLEVLNHWLAEADAWGVVIVDGTPSARTLFYRAAHRDLDIGERRILEDEVVRDSRESHFIQMADIAAHCAFMWLKGDHAHYLNLAQVVHHPGTPPSATEHGFFTR